MIDLETGLDDSSEWLQDPKLSGLALGIIAGFNCLTEALVAAKIIEPGHLAAPLATKIEELQTGTDELTRPDVTRDMLSVLRAMIRPLTAADRAATRRLLTEPPSGSA